MATTPCPACGMLAEQGRVRCHYCKAPMSGAEIPEERTTCISCGAAAREGSIALRSGGSSGGTGFIFGQLAEVGEKVVTFKTLTCTSCGHVAFFLP